MNYNSSGSEISVMEFNGATSNSGCDMQLSVEASRKRKASDLEVRGNFCNVLPHQRNISGSVGYVPPGNSNMQHTLQVPPLVSSYLPQAMILNNSLQSYQTTTEHSQHPFSSSYLTQAMYSNDNMKSSQGTEQQSQFVNYPVCSLANSQTKDLTSEEMSTDSLGSYKRQQKEPLGDANKPSQEVFDSVGSRFSVGSTSIQSESIKHHSQTDMNLGQYDQGIGCLNIVQAASKSNFGMNLQYESCYQPSKPYSSLMTSHLPLVRMFNGCSDPDGRMTLPDVNATEQLKTVKGGHYANFSVDKSIFVGTINTAEPSVLSEGKEEFESFQNPTINIRHNDIPGHLNLTEKELDSATVPAPCPVESSIREKNYVIHKSPPAVSSKLGELSSELLSQTTDNDIKPISGKASSIVSEKIWDGFLQLNTFTTVSATAFFKSGEKAQGISWPELVEVKGKVRLPAFEKFIQELPRSRTRALMVISLCWKAGSSKAGLRNMKEIAKGYKESERVGFAKICSGNDLYVCPRSETIITILAKYGFFKGMAAVEENQDSLIGCIVWHRSSKSSNSGPKRSERKETPLTSPMSSIVEANSPPIEKQDLNSPQATRCARDSHGLASQLLSGTRSSTPDNITTESKAIESSNKSSNHESTRLKSIQPSIPSFTYNSPIYPIQVPAQQKLRPTSSPEVEERMKNSFSQAAERTTSSPQVISEAYQRNILFRGTSHRNSSTPTGHHQLLTHSMIYGVPPIQLQATQRSNTNFQYHLAETAMEVKNPAMHFNESNKPPKQTELTQIALPGPPPLPLEVLQRLMQSRVAVLKPQSTESTMKAETLITHVSQPRKAATMSESLGPVPPGPLPSLPQALVSSTDPYEDDNDDLPDFDFKSECGNPEDQASNHPKPRNPINDVPHLNNHLGINVAKKHTPSGSNIMKSTEVKRRPQVSPLLGESFSRFEEMVAPTSFRKDLTGNKPAFETSKSMFQACLADKINVSSRNSCPIPRTNRWERDDDDDDMPEWCPPNLDHVDKTLSGAATKLPSSFQNFTPEVSALDPHIPFPSRTTFDQSKTQGFRHSSQHGLLGPPPGSHNPITPGARKIPAAGFAPSVGNPTFRPYANNSFRRRAHKYDRRHSSNSGRNRTSSNS